MPTPPSPPSPCNPVGGPAESPSIQTRKKAGMEPVSPPRRVSHSDPKRLDGHTQSTNTSYAGRSSSVLRPLGFKIELPLPFRGKMAVLSESKRKKKETDAASSGTRPS